MQKLGLYSAADVNGDESAEVAYYKKMASANADDVISSRYEKAKYTTESYTKYIEGLAKSAKSNKESAESKLKEITADDYNGKMIIRLKKNTTRPRMSLMINHQVYQGT